MTLQTRDNIALPLAVVIGLIVNAILIGVSWGRNGQRMDFSDAVNQKQTAILEKLDSDVRDLRVQVMFLEKAFAEHGEKQRLFEDYTRGRISRLPYKQY